MSDSSKYIRLTRPKIEQIFDECNAKYFNNEVEKPRKFELWTNNKKCVGWVRAIRDRRKASGHYTILHISSRYRWTEENLRNTILHEMIHLYIKDYLQPLTLWQRIFPSKQHGEDFRQKMNELNESYGLSIVERAKHMRKEFIK